MKPRLFPVTLGLVAIFIMIACAFPTPPLTSDGSTQSATLTRSAGPESTATSGAATAIPTEIPIQGVATSRGPNLEATDPTTVSLASDQLQLVEFFRFT